MAPDPADSIVTFENIREWENWLSEQHDKAHVVWLRIAKKGAPTRTVSYEEALDGALCFGWIDGQRKSLDEYFFLQKFTPRRPRSLWSQRNVLKALKLLDSGRLRPAGLAEIRAAQDDGRWRDAYDSPKNMVIPDDFLLALGANEKASEFFKTLNKSNLFAIGFRLQTARTPETRQRRIGAIIKLLDGGQRLV